MTIGKSLAFHQAQDSGGGDRIYILHVCRSTEFQPGPLGVSGGSQKLRVYTCIGPRGPGEDLAAGTHPGIGEVQVAAAQDVPRAKTARVRYTWYTKLVHKTSVLGHNTLVI